MNQDYYAVLGVPRNADQDAIKKAYRQMAMKFHPDRNPGNQEAEDKFKEAAQAYEILGDPEKRARYDQFGHAAFQGGGRGGGHGFTDINDIFSAFGDVFGDFFGGGTPGRGSRRSRVRRGADLRYAMELELKDVLKGVEKEIQFEAEEACEACEGKGAKAGSVPTTCGTCGGSGQFVRSQGFFSMATTCPSCRGAGELIKDPCPKCKGQGRVEKKRKVQVKVPPGVDQETQLRLSGEGEFGFQGGPAGDLYVELHIREPRGFQRQGTDILTQLKISYLQAILGAEIQVKTLEGTEALRVPPGTASGTLLRLEGHGVPSLRSSRRGDLVVGIEVEIPKKLSKEEEQHLREIAKLKGEAVAEPGGLFGFRRK